MAQTSSTPDDPDGVSFEESLREVAQAMEDDTDLAQDVRDVMKHLASTPIDPTGAPE